MTLHLEGIIPPIITPLRRDGSVDELGLERLTRHMIRSGVAGIFAMGTAGEAPMLTRTQRHAALSTIRRESHGEVPLLVGIMEPSTQRCLELVDEAEEIGADAIVVNTPYYFPVSQTEIIKHCLTIKEATELPIVLYNIPRYTSNAVETSTICQLAETPGIIAYKDSSSNLVHFQEVLRRTRGIDGFSVFQGNHLLSIPSLLMGASGVVAGIANVIPAEMVSLYHAVRAGEIEKAYQLHALVEKLESRLTNAKYSLSMLKGMVEVLGITEEECVPHAPLPPLSDLEKAEVKELFQRENLRGFSVE